MKTKTDLYYDSKVFRTHLWATKKEAKDYKKGILKSFTVHQKVKHNIQVILTNTKTK